MKQILIEVYPKASEAGPERVYSVVAESEDRAVALVAEALEDAGYGRIEAGRAIAQGIAGPARILGFDNDDYFNFRGRHPGNDAANALDGADSAKQRSFET